MSHFDVVGNKMDINTVHDIQDVNLKQDEDIILKNMDANVGLLSEDQSNTLEDITFINNVVENDVTDSDGDGINRILKSNLTPIVYTTRLDDMNIFDKIENYTPKEAAVLIQYESKPQYKQTLPKHEPYGFHADSFMKLNSAIERLNQKVEKTKRRNQELMIICRPLKIVLKDIKYDEAKIRDWGNKSFNRTKRKQKILVNPKMAGKGEVKSVAKFQKNSSIIIDVSDDSESDNMPLTDFIKPSLGTTTVAFIHNKSKKADIYIINNKDLRCSYKTDLESYDSMMTTNPTKNTEVYNVCCWSRREKQIKLLSERGIANDNTISFMRIPHGCTTGPCTCCCILKPSMPSLSSVTFRKMLKNKSETNTVASKLIRKALTSTSKIKLQRSEKCSVDEPITFLRSAVIIMKYTKNICSQSNYLGENFEIGIEGDIDKHMKVTVDRSLAQERLLHDIHDAENNISRQYFSYLICCWYKREEIIVNLSNVHNLSPRAFKYMRNPHLCKSYKCQCCCYSTQIGLPLDDKDTTTLPQSKNQSKGIIKHNKKKPVAIDNSEATKITPGKTVDREMKTKKQPKSVAAMVNHGKSESVHTNSQTVAEPQKESQPYVTKRKTKKQPKSVAVMVNHGKSESVHTNSQTVAEPQKESQPYVTKRKTKKQPKSVAVMENHGKPESVYTKSETVAKPRKKTQPYVTKNKTKEEPKSVAVMVNHGKPENVNTNSQTVAEPRKESPYVTKTIEPPTASNEQITSIFDEIRELNLSVNADGKLLAKISTHPDKLLPEELKALADKLAKASNVMHNLGIGPAEFCRRVNSSSFSNKNPCKGIPDKPLPLKLPIIIQPSPLLPQESISPPPLCPIVKKTVQNTTGIIQPPQAPSLAKQTSQPLKTKKTNMNFPTTTNRSDEVDLYSMMSQTCWIRSRCMISAYNIHFYLEMNVEPESQLETNNLTNRDEQQLPKIVHIQSLVNTAPKKQKKSCRSKKRKKQADKPVSNAKSCKIRAPPETVRKQPVSTLPMSTQMNMTGLANLSLTNKVSQNPSQENLLDTNNSFTPIQNVNGVLASPLPNAGNNIKSGAPTKNSTEFDKIWTHINGQLVELKVLGNMPSENNIASFGNPKTATHTPIITVDNGIPMQVRRLCEDTEDEEIKAPTVNEETEDCAMNSILRDLLTRDSSLPNLRKSTRRNGYTDSLKRTVTPLMLEHSKELQTKRRKVLDDPTVSDPASKENFQNAKTEDSIQIIDSDDEQETIFGV